MGSVLRSSVPKVQALECSHLVGPSDSSASQEPEAIVDLCLCVPAPGGGLWRHLSLLCFLLVFITRQAIPLNILLATIHFTNALCTRMCSKHGIFQILFFMLPLAKFPPAAKAAHKSFMHGVIVKEDLRFKIFVDTENCSMCTTN